MPLRIGGHQRKAKTWTNWARNQSCEPLQILRPRTADEVADIVSTAAARGQRVKVAATGHSFSAAALTEGTLLSIEALSGIEAVDEQRPEVTVGAGTSLRDLNTDLDRLGYALSNLGDINVQTVAGATSTGTHGTGADLGNLSTQIVAMELINGRGEIIRLSESENPELLRAAKVGVGALGAITKVTLKVVPAFNLKVSERGRKLEALLDDFDAFVDANDYAEFFWFPGSEYCLVKENNRTAEPIAPQSRTGYLRDKILGENLAWDLINRTAKHFPSTRPKLGKVVAAVSSERTLIDKSFKIFSSPRYVRFMEMEYSIPREVLPEAMRRVRDVANDQPVPPMFPVEVRVSAADDIPLSTGYGRDSAWIAVHRYKGLDYDGYFKAVEAVMDDYDGRPHWGKYHYQTHETLQHRYPEWDAFMAARSKLDPGGTFANDYTNRVLGETK